MKLLLHTCCAPCSVYCIDSLREEGIEPTIYWYNPNIHPYMEYKARRDCLKEYTKSIEIEAIFEEEYGLDEFCKEAVKKLNARCVNYCYPVRLRKTFEYAKEHGFTNLVHFTDDGISGTRFDRPGFLAMMKEVESGKVGTILIKDMSRMGRDYLKVGQYMELLRQKNVRLIAVNENVDSFREDDDFTPFRNIMNEWYARDTSKKIKSTFKAKGKSGKHVASTTPYGYLKDKDDPNVWIVDEEAAVVVRRIFHMTMDGYGPYQIAKALKEDKVEIPAVHMAKKDAGLWKGRVKEIKDPYGWGSSTVAGILKKREYLGHTVNFKTRKHFKDKKSHYVSQDNWVIFENTQEPIVDQETFDLVQKIRSTVRRYPDGWGEIHLLTGLMYCADCGAKMYVHRTYNGKREAQYTCSAYSKVPVGELCKTQHRVSEKNVIQLITELLRSIAEYSGLDREAFIQTVRQAQEKQSTADILKLKQTVEDDCRRLDELETLICRIYEDNILGKLPDDRYMFLSSSYAATLSLVTVLAGIIVIPTYMVLVTSLLGAG